jgi:eukaryotic-like serine/threonine-protein kinase
MAVVYLGHDTELGRPVAVKVLADHALADDAFRARFAREGRVAARLSHPNIVQVFDVGEDGGRPFIVMEYVAGESLGDMIARERRVPPERVVEIAQQCCAGLACAHAGGLVHRDVKPGNLLVAEDGVVKVADFGVAHALDQTRLTMTGSIVGTAAYLAPEQTTGETVTAAADVYALGVVMYELLTGRQPHRGRSLPELVIAKRTKAVKPLRAIRRDIPAELEAAVLACLAVEAHERPTAEALAARLGEAPTRVLPRKPAPAATIPARPAPRVFAARRRPGRLVIAVVVLVTAAVIGVLGTTLSSGGDTQKPRPLRTPAGPTPAAHAHNLAHWIRGHTG